MDDRDGAVARTAVLFENGAATAVVCYNDSVALGLMAGLLARGVMPGRDFALTGFDGIAEAALAVPALTTVSADPRGRGRQAAALVLDRAREAPQSAPRRLTAAVTLQVRQSCGAMPDSPVSPQRLRARMRTDATSLPLQLPIR